MSIVEKLASSLGRRDEIPNQELAEQIAKKNDAKAVQELVANLAHKSKDIQSDCIKVLYEIGERKPELIAPYAQSFADLLQSKNNRLQWGAMTALSAIAITKPEPIYTALPHILSVADKGSVITKDHAVKILVALCSVKKYENNAFPLLIEQLQKSFVNQLPMYAELAAPIIHDKNKSVFVKTLISRLDDIDKESKKKRVEKIIRRFS